MFHLLVRFPIQIKHRLGPVSPRMIGLSLMGCALLSLASSCRTDSDSLSLRPRQLRDVPANRLALNFQADVEPPPGLPSEEAKIIAAIQQDFDTRRKDEALLRTIASPD